MRTDLHFPKLGWLCVSGTRKYCFYYVLIGPSCRLLGWGSTTWHRSAALSPASSCPFSIGFSVGPVADTLGWVPHSDTPENPQRRSTGQLALASIDLSVGFLISSSVGFSVAPLALQSVPLGWFSHWTPPLAQVVVSFDCVLMRPLDCIFVSVFADWFSSWPQSHHIRVGSPFGRSCYPQCGSATGRFCRRSVFSIIFSVSVLIGFSVGTFSEFFLWATSSPRARVLGLHYLGIGVGMLSLPPLWTFGVLK